MAVGLAGTTYAFFFETRTTHALGGTQKAENEIGIGRKKNPGFAVDRSQQAVDALARARGPVGRQLSSYFTFHLLIFCLQLFFSSLTFYHEIYIKIFFSKFSISEFFAELFFILNLSCTKILHHDFSFQKLSMSKYSSPNFNFMKSFCQRFFFQFFFKVLFIIVSRRFVSLDPENRTR